MPQRIEGKSPFFTRKAGGLVICVVCGGFHLMAVETPELCLNSAIASSTSPFKPPLPSAYKNTPSPLLITSPYQHHIYEAVRDAHIPVVDLANRNRATVVSQIGAACRSHGFFQRRGGAELAHEFFRIPPEEKAKLCSDEPAKKMRLSTSFNVRMETVHDWRDHLRLHHHPLEQFVPDWPANPPPLRLSEGTPLKSSGYGENRHESKMFALVAPQSLSPGDGSSSSTGAPVPLLWLDSGASIHMVSDAKILTNLRDPPTRMVVTVADGSQLPITKVGVIQAPNINISDVYLAPGLEMNLISVRQLAKSGIVTTFYENYAELWLEGERIGGAIADNDVSLYRLCFFKPHE